MKSLVLLLLALMCSVTHAQEVTATGNGSSYSDALQNAKVLATEYVASTFVTGREDLINGQYKETLGQYNGGMIQKYVVLNTTVVNGTYAVTIRADVDTDKVNEIVVSNTTSVNTVAPHVDKAVDEFTKTANGWAAISNVSSPFAITLDNSTYRVYDGHIVDVAYHLHMQWNPKWIDDARQLTLAVHRSPVSGEGTYAVCFVQSAGNACGGVLVLPDMKHLASSRFIATVHFKDGTTETRTVYATPAQRLYSTHDVKIQEAGWHKPIVTVEAVSFFTKEVSPFDLHTSFSVEQFNTVEDVTFAQ